MWQEIWPNSLVKVHSDEKPYGCYVTRNFYKLPSQNPLLWKAIWLLLIIVWQEICPTLRSECTCQNKLRWKTIWLLLMWQEIFGTLLPSDEKPFGCCSCEKNVLQTPNFKYTLMKNRLAATWVTRNLPTLASEWSCQNTLKIKTICLLLM